MKLRSSSPTAARLLALRRRLSRRFLRDPGPTGHWIRQVMNGELDRFLSSIDIESSSAVEVSGGSRSRMGWRRHVSVSFPRFDVCRPYEGDATYDVVFCEQVLEHVTAPWTAMRTLHDMARPGRTRHRVDTVPRAAPQPSR